MKKVAHSTDTYNTNHAGRQPVKAGLMITKIILLGLLNALALWAIPILWGDSQWILLGVLVIATAGIDYAFLSKKALPLRFMLPGLLFMMIMVIFPIGYTVYVAFTNFGTGHILTKAQAVDQYTHRYLLQENLPVYTPEYYTDNAGQFAVLLTDPDGRQLVGYEQTLYSLAESPLELVDEDGDGVFDKIGNLGRLGGLEVFSYLGQFEKLVFQYDDHLDNRTDVYLKMRSMDQFASYVPQFEYSAASDTLTDLEDGTAYRVLDGSFVSDSGETLDVGFRTTVGWRNFTSLLTNKRIAGPFWQVFSWTIVWAILSVVTTFALGLLLAVLLNDAKLKLRALYRVLLIIPYTLPAFISALIWRGMFNTEVGLINNVLGMSIPWLQDPFWAKVALIIVNLWLGFPYMMIISLGALQSIPTDLYEAATVDGASGWHQFWKITFPLLLVSLAPLLIASFAFNFNNFSVIYLVTEGRPAIAGALTPTGATDILITYTYRLAFEGGSGGRYGLASAVSILIFLIVGTISWFNFRFTGALEEVNDNG
ncbi:MAG TPA: maltose ABC transporter permease MalF [Firmicutes bacterium]|nr:maltose ABC transporter permease MalF [Bacillota bacterium]HCT36809.1 maltose ABC transporter permease MalF [Bacillota bacterium]